MQENLTTAPPTAASAAAVAAIKNSSSASAGAAVATTTVTATTTASSNPSTTPTNTATSNANDIDQAQFEADKRAVYKHPLFSLLALLLEKCEQATQGYISSSNSSASSPNGSTNGKTENDSFSRDIQTFVHLLEKEKRPLLTNDTELDGLMIKALQVLRIHLLELEKVQELCRDFCTRYIACLRGKMQSENLLRSDYSMEHNNNLSNSNSPINSPVQDGLSGHQGYYGSPDFLSTSGNDGNDYNSIQGAYNLHNNSSTGGGIENGSNDGSVVLINHTSPPPQPPQSASQPPTQQQQTPQQLQQHQNNLLAAVVAPQQILGSTPLSQIGCPPLNIDQYAGQLSPCGSSDEIDSEIDSNNDELGSNISNNSGSKRQKRGILPKHATSVMRAWLFQHLVHPYPTEDEKRTIAAQTNLTLLQVNNWFINARRRILQPMLEHASDNNSSARKKSSGQSPPPTNNKRYWPENLSTNNTALQLNNNNSNSNTAINNNNNNSSSNHTNSNQSSIDPNIENISANINRVDTERLLLAAASQKLQAGNFYSSDESNDSLVIDQEN